MSTRIKIIKYLLNTYVHTSYIIFCYRNHSKVQEGNRWHYWRCFWTNFGPILTQIWPKLTQFWNILFSVLQEPLKSADEVIKEIDDIIDAADEEDDLEDATGKVITYKSCSELQ